MGDAEKELDIIVKAIAQNTAALQDVTTSVDKLDASVAASAVTHEKHAAASHKVAEEERVITTESRESAKAFGELGAKGGELFERFNALTTAAGGLQGTLTGGLLLGLGAVVEGGMKVDEVYQEQQHSAENLTQAVKATLSPYEDQASALEEVNSRFEEFVNSNARFIDNENSAKDALASFIRAGFDADTSMEALGVSLNLAGMKNEDFATAANQTLQIMEGQGRIAKQLGIDMKTLAAEDDSATGAHKALEAASKAVTTAQNELAAAEKRQQTAAESLKKEQDTLAASHKVTAAQADTLHQAEQRVADTNQQVTDATGKLTTAQGQLKDAQDHVNNSMADSAKRLDELKQKTDGGTGAITQQAQSERELGHQWDQFAKSTGPDVNYAWLVILGTLEGVLELINDIPGAVSAAITALTNLKTAQDSAVARGRTAQYVQNVPGESGTPVSAGGGGGGNVGQDARVAAGGQIVFNIQAQDTEATAAAVMARLLQAT